MQYSFLLILFLSCSTTKYDPHHSSYKQKSYAPYIPSGYELVVNRGIDSYVGEVKNDQITFDFDYGMYSDSGPTSMLSLKNMITSEFALKSLKPSCGVDSLRDKKVRKGLQIDSVYYSSSDPKSSVKKVIVELTIEDVLCEFETKSLQYMVEDIYQNNFIEREKKGFALKIFYPKSDSLNYAGIYITKKNDMNALSYFTKNYSKQDHDEILDILLEVGENYMSQM